MPPSQAAAPCSAQALRAALPHYAAVLAAKAGVSAKRGYDLAALDAWYRGEFAASLRHRGEQGEAHVTKEELQRLMQWKLARGNWRPRLEELVASNAAAEVRRVSQAAFALHHLHLVSSSSAYGARERRAVLEAWQPLKGVGAATATALMAAYAPRHFAFMSDEALSCVGLAHKYTFPHAQAYCEAMLQRVEDAQLQLDELERAAYALVAGRKLAPSLVADVGSADGQQGATAARDHKAKTKSTAGGATKGEGSSNGKASAPTSKARPAPKRKAPAASSADAADAEEPRRRSARLR